MAQRNPLNPRYQGEGPGGQTKKSAASAKPVSEAASSVRIKGKPTTPSEKKAAAKAREKEAQRKAAEKERKAAEKAKAVVAESDVIQASDTKAAAPVETAPKQNFFQKLFSPAPNMPNTPEYKMWRRRYWMLMGGGIASVTFSWIFQTILPNVFSLWVIFMVAAYICIAVAFFVDFKRVRPLIKEYQKGGGDGKKSPKQLKHQQESAQRAAELEEARKAAKAAKATKRKSIIKRDKKDADS